MNETLVEVRHGVYHWQNGFLAIELETNPEEAMWAAYTPLGCRAGRFDTLREAAVEIEAELPDPDDPMNDVSYRLTFDDFDCNVLLFPSNEVAATRPRGGNEWQAMEHRTANGFVTLPSMRAAVAYLGMNRPDGVTDEEYYAGEEGENEPDCVEIALSNAENYLDSRELIGFDGDGWYLGAAVRSLAIAVRLMRDA